MLTAFPLVALAAQLALRVLPATLPPAPVTAQEPPRRGPPSAADARPDSARARASRQEVGPPSRPTRRVLLLYTESAQQPAIALIDREIRRRLAADTSWTIELFEEHLGLTGAEDGATNRLTYEYIRRKYADRHLDVVIGAALSRPVVAKLSAGELVGDVPTVLLSSSPEELASGFKSGRVTGMTIRADAAATLEAALALQPELKHVLVVVGTNDFERGLERSVREQLRGFGERLRLEYTTQLSFPDVRRRAAALGRGSAVLFVSFQRDGGGGRHVTVLALEELARASRVPIYGLAATHLGYGIVGGSLLDFAVLSERATSMARSMLAGSPPSAIPIDLRPATSYTFDWVALQRFGLDSARLPPGSRVANQVESPWVRYRWPLLILVALCVAESILLATLYRQIRQRRAAERSRESYRQLELLLVRLSAKLVAASAAELDAVSEEILAQVSEFLGVQRAMLALLDESGTSVRVVHTWSAEGVGAARPIGPTELRRTWARLQRGEAIEFSSLASLPDDLVPDRSLYEAAGVKSGVGVPLMEGGRCFGVLTVATVGTERSWEPGLVDGLSLLGLVLTSSMLRRRTELEVTQRREELSHLARVGIVGELSASLAHEINQPLGAILLSVQAAQRWMASSRPEPLEVARLLERVSDDVRRTYAIIDRLRRLLRKQPTDLSDLRLDELVAGTVALLSGDAMRRRITLTQSPSSGVPVVRGDRVQLEQVVVNLVLNAFDSIVATNAPERHARLSVDATPRGGVVVAVEDSGGGIAPDRLESIFEPFITSKLDGIGMGLAICRMIVESHGGQIWAENLPRGGARVAFTLAADSSAAAAERQDGERARPGEPSLTPLRRVELVR